MTAIPVECLRCGKRHRLLRTSRSTMDQSECPRCGYVGWTPARAVAQRLLATKRIGWTPARTVAQRLLPPMRTRIAG